MRNAYKIVVEKREGK